MADSSPPKQPAKIPKVTDAKTPKVTDAKTPNVDPIKKQFQEEKERKLQLEQSRKEKLHKDAERDVKQQKELLAFLAKTNIMESSEEVHRKEAESIGKAKLLEQNHKLKEQLAAIATELDEVNNQGEERRLVKRVIKVQDDNESLSIKKIELRQQQQEIAKLEKHIFGLQKQLETSYDIYKVMAKEDELQLLKSEYAALLEERDSQVGSVVRQVKATEFLRNEELYNLKLKNLSEKLIDSKHQHQELNAEIQQYEADLNKLNRNIKFKEERIREMEDRIKERMKYPERQFYVTEEELAVLEQRVEELEHESRQNAHRFGERMRQLEYERKEKQKEADMKIIAVRELEKELKMNQLKFKELTKLIRHNILPPMEKKLPIDIK